MLSFVYITRTYLPAEARPKAVAPLAVVLFSVESELNYDPVEFIKYMALSLFLKNS